MDVRRRIVIVLVIIYKSINSVEDNQKKKTLTKNQSLAYRKNHTL